MSGFDISYLGKHKKFRIAQNKLITVLSLFALILVIVVFWLLKIVGMTVTGEAFCNLEEHSHDDNCFVEETLCQLSENETGEGSASESHHHSDECYNTTLVCKIPEHTHSADCYPDKSADCETSKDWIDSFGNIEIGNNIPENIIAIASTQLGYTESQKNYEFDAAGIKKGYTRYGEWYGSPYGNWNATFVSFCINYSNVAQNDFLFSSNTITMQQNWQKEGYYVTADSHVPQPGELIFLDSDNDEVIDMVAIITEITGTEIKAVVGDYNDCVAEIVVDDSFDIIGYGLTYLLPVSNNDYSEVPSTETDISGEEITDNATEDCYHIHSDDCYTSDGLIVCSEWGKVEPWGLDRDSDEFKDKSVKYVSYLINQIPDADVFENRLNELDSSEDFDGYEAYYLEVYHLVEKAYVNFENLPEELRETVINKELLAEYAWLYSNTSTFAVIESRNVQFVNYYDNATANTTILIHSNNVGSYSTFGFYWWYAVVVDENEYGELIVTNKYGYELTNKSNLEPTTAKGFVLISHGDSNAFDCEVGDEVSVNFDYLNSQGKNSNGFGTVTFSDYVPPENPTTQPDVPDSGGIVEDFPVSSIDDGELSDSQVKDAGGKTTSIEGDVEISKQIDGTDIENVFDITLTVRTESSIQTYLADPDMAVVIVMDISNTMNSKYPSGSSTSRYDAAVVAAENFINQFAQKGRGISTLGFVAFNTHAHEIFSLQSCTASNAAALINEMKADTEYIIDNYSSDDRTRFTNVEGGLKMAYDMLNTTDNENKYIIFLSDGFPTTYLVNNSSNNTDSFYEGYDPYTSSGTKGADGVFYDYVTKYYCSYGTSYSDKASIKARVMATNIKNSGTKIFSIGIDVGGQTIAGYDGRTGLSVIDRTSTTYEIGDASSTAAYQNWLRNSIGSGYYYDSTNQTEITAAFNEIFTEIENLNKESRETTWTTTDPLPILGEDSYVVEFVNFYDKDGNPAYDINPEGNYAYIDGEFGVGLENTAYHKDKTVFWDIKDSGYYTDTSEDGNTTYFYYSIKYRVRLYNEAPLFEEYTTYSTNGDACLEYKTVITTNGVTTVSENKKLYFEKPAVEGYYEEFTFTKQSDLGDPIEGAVFTLTHDDASCNVCHGNGYPVTTVSTLGPFTSEADGTVVFSRIPSGHIYILKETVVPEGYAPTEKIYKVTISMDNLSIMIYESEEDTVGKLWENDQDFVFVNQAYVYILPETGGHGMISFYAFGFLLMVTPVVYRLYQNKRKRFTE